MWPFDCSSADSRSYLLCIKALITKSRGGLCMLDEKDLQAIQSIIADAEQRITKNTVMMMETKFEKRFNLLAEGQSAILEKLKKAQ